MNWSKSCPKYEFIMPCLFRYYIGGKIDGSLAVQPYFGVSTWNKFAETCNDLPRTNNSCEGEFLNPYWHVCMRVIIGKTQIIYEFYLQNINFFLVFCLIIIIKLQFFKDSTVRGQNHLDLILISGASVKKCWSENCSRWRLFPLILSRYYFPLFWTNFKCFTGMGFGILNVHIPVYSYTCISPFGKI